MMPKAAVSQATRPLMKLGLNAYRLARIFKGEESEKLTAKVNIKST
jgi:hypothetical protein